MPRVAAATEDACTHTQNKQKKNEKVKTRGQKTIAKKVEKRNKNEKQQKDEVVTNESKRNPIFKLFQNKKGRKMCKKE